jgi:hypothetical protein
MGELGRPRLPRFGGDRYIGTYHEHLQRHTYVFSSGHDTYLLEA